MPGHWEPWPGNTRATSPPVPAVPRTSPGASRPAARASRPARNSSGRAPISTARCSCAARVVARAWPISAGPGPGWASRCARSRAAWARSAGAVRPESTQGSTAGAAGPAGSAGSGTGGSSACSRTTCPLVPLTPKEETAARRGRPVSGQGVLAVTSRTAPAVQSICGDGSPACRVGGTVPCRMARTVLMTPPTPAAAWVCPMFDFSDPSSSGCPSARCCP